MISSLIYWLRNPAMAEERTEKSRRWRWIAVALVVIAVFFVARYFLRDRMPVRVAHVELETLRNEISTNARVEPVDNIQYYSPINTTVKAVHVREGETVPAGKLLIVLDDVSARSQVASAESAVRTAQANLDAVTHNGTQAERQSAAAEVEQDRLARDQAQHDLAALTQLAATGSAAPGEVAAARERLATAQASLDAAEQNAHHRFSPDDLSRAQAALNDARAALDAARHVEAQTSYSAPVAGTIYTLNAASSQFVAAGKLLLEMADLHHERVRAYFDEPDVGKLAVGQNVSIRWEAKPGREWHGHIAVLPATIVEYTTRHVGEVLIDFDEASNELPPQSNVTVTVTISSEPNALSMPREALHEQNGKYFVFKVVGNELKRTPVTIGPATITEVPILTGLQDGDIVATGTTTGQPLQEGVPIQVVQ
jgi:HlyD family secretion protein